METSLLPWFVTPAALLAVAGFGWRYLNRLEDRLEKRISGFEKNVGDRLASVDRRLESLESGLQWVDRRLARIEGFLAMVTRSAPNPDDPMPPDQQLIEGIFVGVAVSRQLRKNADPG